MVNETVIGISKEIKKELDNIKIHPRETYDDIIKRLIHGKTKEGEKKC